MKICASIELSNNLSFILDKELNSLIFYPISWIACYLKILETIVDQSSNK
jgi:hypothetical protein